MVTIAHLLGTIIFLQLSQDVFATKAKLILESSEVPSTKSTSSTKRRTSHAGTSTDIGLRPRKKIQRAREVVSAAPVTKGRTKKVAKVKASMQDFLAASPLHSGSNADQIHDVYLKLRQKYGRAGHVNAAFREYLDQHDFSPQEKIVFEDLKMQTMNKDNRVAYFRRFGMNRSAYSRLKGKGKTNEKKRSNNISKEQRNRESDRKADYRDRVARANMDRFQARHEAITGPDAFRRYTPYKYVTAVGPVRKTLERKSYGRRFANMMKELDAPPTWQETYRDIQATHARRRHNRKRAGIDYDSADEPILNSDVEDFRRESSVRKKRKVTAETAMAREGLHGPSSDSGTSHGSPESARSDHSEPTSGMSSSGEEDTPSSKSSSPLRIPRRTSRLPFRQARGRAKRIIDSPSSSEDRSIDAKVTPIKNEVKKEEATAASERPTIAKKRFRGATSANVRAGEDDGAVDDVPPSSEGGKISAKPALVKEEVKKEETAAAAAAERPTIAKKKFRGASSADIKHEGNDDGVVKPSSSSEGGTTNGKTVSFKEVKEEEGAAAAGERPTIAKKKFRGAYSATVKDEEDDDAVVEVRPGQTAQLGLKPRTGGSSAAQSMHSHLP